MTMAARRASEGFDLLAWPAVSDARARLAAAEAARIEAHRRWRIAPHGEVESRLMAFREATQAELKAAAALRAVMQGALR